MDAAPAIALVDGEHHPSAVREALDRLDGARPLAGVVLVGGGEKLPAGSLEQAYGRPVREGPAGALREGPAAALRELAAAGAAAVVDLADEPALPASARLRLASLALHLGLAYEAPGLRLEPPRYEPLGFPGPKLAVIGTAKRTGKTAVAGHWAALLREAGLDPAMVCMGRGGPAEPRAAEANTALDELLAIVEGGGHGASDYLEDAVLAGVRTVGCRRVGGGPAGAPAESNVLAGAELAASLEPGAIVLEGSGACIPPVAADRTVCVAGAGVGEPFAEVRLLRADLILAGSDGSAERARAVLAELGSGCGSAPGAGDRERPALRATLGELGEPRVGEPEVLRFELRPEPAEPVPSGARVALFTTGAPTCEGVEPAVASTNLARRDALAADLERAAAAGCDLYLTELKAAAIDTVATRARAEGVRLGFVRNRPVGIDGDLDAALMALVADG